MPIAEALTARHVPFVFVSGTDPDIVHAALPGATVLDKPVVEQTLARLMRTLPH